MQPGELEIYSLICDAMDGRNCLWKTGDIYVLVTWRYVVTRSKILLSEEQLQLARKCDWISLRADIICFVRQPVFLKFRSRKLNARKFVPQTNLRAYNLHREIHATRRARNTFLGLWRDGRYKLPVKNQKYIPFGYVTLCCTAIENIIEWRTASISTKTWLDFLACGHYLFRELNSFPYVSLSEICLFRGTDNLHGQIYEHIFSSQIKVILFIVLQILLRQNILLGQNLTLFSGVLWFDYLNKKLFSSFISNTQKQYALPSTLNRTGNIRWYFSFITRVNEVMWRVKSSCPRAKNIWWMNR